MCLFSFNFIQKTVKHLFIFVDVAYFFVAGVCQKHSRAFPRVLFKAATVNRIFYLICIFILSKKLSDSFRKLESSNKLMSEWIVKFKIHI